MMSVVRTVGDIFCNHLQINGMQGLLTQYRPGCVTAHCMSGHEGNIRPCIREVSAKFYRSSVPFLEVD
jgi:hypothetical protein